MNRFTETLKGVSASLVFVLILVGVPLALIALVGWPMPTSLSSLTEITTAINRPITDSVFQKVLAIICWCAWAQFVWCAFVEIGAWLGQRAANQVRFAGGTQILVRQLVLASVMLFTSFTRNAPASVPMPAAIHVVAESPVVATPIFNVPTQIAAPTEKMCTVQARDDLWSLAERHLGDPLRWKEIYELNKGVAQADGNKLERSDLIRPGWTLKMPTDATGLDSTMAVVPDVEAEAPSSPIPESVAPTSPVTSDTTPPPTDAPLNQQSQPDPQEESPSTEQDEVAEAGNHHLGLVGIGIGAVGIVAALDRRRRVQQRKRRSGERISPPRPDLVDTESVLRRTADLPAAKRLDQALRALGTCLSQGDIDDLPAIDAVRVTTSKVEILFGGSVIAPAGPFEVTADGRAWTIDATVDGLRLDALAEQVVATVPSLTSVGTNSDEVVLIDLESHAITSIVGSGIGARALHESMALELATHVWADYVNVIVAGPLALHANLEGIRRTDSIEEAIKDISAEALATRSALADGRFSSTLRARLVDGTSEGWVPTVLFCTSSQAKHLPDIPPNAGVAVVVLGPIESATRVIDVRPDELIVSPPGIHMDGIAFSSNEVQALDNLLAATQEPASSAPIPDAIDLRDEPSSEYEDADVKVDVLGTVHVRGSESEIDRNRASELVAYLALHPKGVSTHRLKTAIWPGRTPTQSSFNSTVSYARTRLGKAPDGSHHLPVVIDGTNYRVGATVQSDAEALRQYVSAAEFATPANAVELLRSALSLVRGLPFAETAGGYEWAHAEGIITELTSLIADASHRLATLALDAGDASLARWAANQGLLASPGYEVLYRDLMLAFALEGNRSGIETSMQELRRVLDVDEDHDQLQTETRELYEELVGSGAKAIRR